MCSKTVRQMTLAVFCRREEHSKGVRRVDVPRRDRWAFGVFALLLHRCTVNTAMILQKDPSSPLPSFLIVLVSI